MAKRTAKRKPEPPTANDNEATMVVTLIRRNPSAHPRRGLSHSHSGRIPEHAVC